MGSEPAKPLFVGRLLRVIFGVATLGVIPYFAQGDFVLGAVIVFLGVSFLLGGLLGHPGCEVAVLPSLVLRKRIHFV